MLPTSSRQSLVKALQYWNAIGKGAKIVAVNKEKVGQHRLEILGVKNVKQDKLNVREA